MAETPLPRKLQKRIVKWLDSPHPLAILGPRQSGKSTLLELLKRDIRKRWGDRRQILSFDLDNSEHLAALDGDPGSFREYCFASGAEPAKDLVVFIDEIQNIFDPVRFLNHVVSENPTFKFIFSGSTAFSINKFKGKLALDVKVFHLMPLDFEEFLMFKGRKRLHSALEKCGFHCRGDLDAKADGIQFANTHKAEMLVLFQEYALFGGFPNVVLARSQSEKIDRLREILTATELKSINRHFDIAHLHAFRNFFKWVAGESGNLINVNALSRILGIGRDTVRRYLNALEETFIIYTLPPYHNGHPKELTKMPRVYFSDTGLRNLAINSFSELPFRPDRDRLFRNTVFSELRKNLREKDKLYFWRTISRNRIDFLIDGRRKLAFQAAALPNGSKNQAAAFRAFKKIYQKFNRVVVNQDRYGIEDGVLCLPGWMI